MNYVNLTPHTVVVEYGNSETIHFEPCGIVARVEMELKETVSDGKIRNFKKEVKGVTGIPEPEPETRYIVSSMVFDATDRDDVVAPNTNNATRNEKGFIISVPGFITK